MSETIFQGLEVGGEAVPVILGLVLLGELGPDFIGEGGLHGGVGGYFGEDMVAGEDHVADLHAKLVRRVAGGVDEGHIPDLLVGADGVVDGEVLAGVDVPLPLLGGYGEGVVELGQAAEFLLEGRGGGAEDGAGVVLLEVVVDFVGPDLGAGGVDQARRRSRRGPRGRG